MRGKYRHFIDGERIYLREIRPSDATKEYCSWMNDPEVLRHLESQYYEGPYTLDLLSDYIQKTLQNPNVAFFAIVAKDKDKFIGTVKLESVTPTDLPVHRYCYIGFLIGDKSYWGKGYATEAIRLTVRYAFESLKLHKLFASCYGENKAAIKALQNAGFEIEYVSKSKRFFNGRFIDEVGLAILNKDDELEATWNPKKLKRH
jgi:RimJ/RimL family protein N-acetyltransferase